MIIFLKETRKTYQGEVVYLFLVQVSPMIYFRAV